jgi:hypothetical protein
MAKMYCRAALVTPAGKLDFKIRFLPLTVSAQLLAERQALGPLVFKYLVAAGVSDMISTVFCL